MIAAVLHMSPGSTVIERFSDPGWPVGAVVVPIEAGWLPASWPTASRGLARVTRVDHPADGLPHYYLAPPDSDLDT